MNISNFKIISILEGLSLISLFAISMPLKYMLDYHGPNKVIGMIHGILFVLYVFMAFSLRSEQNWTNKQFAVIMICSVIPGGTLWMEKRYLRA